MLGTGDVFDYLLYSWFLDALFIFNKEFVKLSIGLFSSYIMDEIYLQWNCMPKDLLYNQFIWKESKHILL